MYTQLSTNETSFSPFGSGLKFESTDPTIDPPENQGGGGGTGTTAPQPEEEEPEESSS